MKRLLLLALLVPASLYGQTTRYLVGPGYSSIRSTIVKWEVMKEEGILR